MSPAERRALRARGYEVAPRRRLFPYMNRAVRVQLMDWLEEPPRKSRELRVWLSLVLLHRFAARRSRKGSSIE